MTSSARQERPRRGRHPRLTDGRSSAMTALRTGRLCMSFALAVAASGCGSSSSSKSPATRAAATAQASSAAAPLPAPAPRLSILSPRAGARTGPTLTMRVALSGTSRAGRQPFRYVLDRRLTRSGGARLTLHDLAPGRHRLEVLSTGSSATPAVTTFTVRAPAPMPSPSQAQVPSTVPTPPPAPAPSSAPSTSGGIPQNGGGDGDADNSGGPSDGDGNR